MCQFRENPERGNFLSVKMKNLIKVLKVFYDFLLERKFLYGIFLISVITYSFLYSLVPYFYKLFVDRLESGNFALLYKTLIIFIFVKFLAFMIEAAAYYMGDRVLFNAARSARLKIFQYIQDLDFAFHSSKSTGSLISIIKRGDGSFWSLHHAIHIRFLELVVSFTVMVYFLGQIDPLVILILITSFFLAVVLSRVLVGINIRTRRVSNEAEDFVSGIITDNMINFETVKLFAKESWEHNRLKEAFIPWWKALWKHLNTFRMIDLSMGTLINVSIFFVLLTGINRIRSATLSVGDFVLMLAFVNMFYPKLFELVWGLREIGKNFTDIEKYFGILENEIQIKDPEDPLLLEKVSGEINFKNVSFTYSEGKKEAVKSVNLPVRQGQSIALVGRSGSGKTTLMRLLMRFYDIDEGVITIDGIDIRKFTKSHLRSFMGIVPQEPVLFNNTIEYNVGYGKGSVARKEIIAAAKIANLHDFILGLPKKYKTHVGERGIKLSGGQKQRLAIARMILSDPDIIIFDEATSQLDSENERLIQEALWKVAKDKTTIIIAHRLSTAMRADKIVVMDKGRIVEIGSHLDLLAREKSLYKHFWDLQVRSDANDANG